MTTDSISQLMQDAAQDAVAYAGEEFQLTLDNSLASLTLIDQILSELHQRELQQAHSAELLFTLCNMLGAYIGEVFIAHAGGQWQYNQVDEKAPFIYVQHNDKEFPFASVCYAKITQDNSVRLANYVQLAMVNAMQ